MRAWSPCMTIFQKQLEIMAPARGFVDVTNRVQAVVTESRVTAGLCTVFVLHTSASLLIQENADPAVRRDLERLMEDLAPESRDWEHDDEIGRASCRERVESAVGAV